MAGQLLCDEDNEPMVYISRDTADAKAAIIATTPGIAKASVRARYVRGEMLGYVIRVIPRGMLE